MAPMRPLAEVRSMSCRIRCMPSWPGISCEPRWTTAVPSADFTAPITASGSAAHRATGDIARKLPRIIQHVNVRIIPKGISEFISLDCLAADLYRSSGCDFWINWQAKPPFPKLMLTGFGGAGGSACDKDALESFYKRLSRAFRHPH